MRLYGTINDIIRNILDLDNSKLYKCDIDIARSKRSIEQNKLLWKVINEIAKATHQDDMDVYTAVLERADALSEYIITAKEMENALRETFRGVKFIRKQDVNGKECNVYKVFLGSSKMNTKEMAELLEITIQIATEYGIPTVDYEEY